MANVLQENYSNSFIILFIIIQTLLLNSLRWTCCHGKPLGALISFYADIIEKTYCHALEPFILMSYNDKSCCVLKGKSSELGTCGIFV